MTSLTDVYDGDVGSVVDRRRRVLGTALFLVGAGIVVAAIAVATTGLRTALGLGLYEAREVAGLLAGVGLPAVFLGIFAVLPAGRTVRAAAAIGASLALFGVSLFAYAYPDRWLTVDPVLTVATVLLYSLGTLTTVWCMFVALATLKTRNDPGGTARMEITEEGTIRVIESESNIPGFGSVGLFGKDPDGSVETQTNRPSHAADGGTGVASASDGGTEVFGGGGSAGTGGTGAQAAGTAGTGQSASTGSTGTGTASSGGRSASPGSGTGGSKGGAPSSPDRPHPNATSDGGARILEDRERDEHATPDAYCGNCDHFEYVKVEGELEPYCAVTGTVMEDMEACPDWTGVQ